MLRYSNFAILWQSYEYYFTQTTFLKDNANQMDLLSFSCPLLSLSIASAYAYLWQKECEKRAGSVKT